MGKRFTICLIFTLLVVSFTFSQEERYLFEKFEDAVVFFKNNSRSQEKINYDLITDKFCFIDKASGEILEIAGSEKIRVIKIGERNFMISNKVGVEVLPTTPVIHVQYKARVRPEAARGAYGTKSETTAVTTYGSISSGSGNIVELDSRKIIAASKYNIYSVEVNGKMKKFMNSNQFTKIYKNHSKELEEYIKNNNINFDDMDQVVDLCVYAHKL